MSLSNILSMAGGLALFLYGMSSMGDGLSKLAGSKLEKILEKLTSKTIYGVLLGILVTAVIQSSSATTVMVVGFVNSGIMTLNQAVGIIMGANVGTTVTSWLLSLIGLQGDSPLISLMKPASLASICALTGILMIMIFKKSSRNKDIGGILLGFAVLMFGMETMSAAVKPLADNPHFISILTIFTNPIMGIIAGAVLTAIIQSSSASVGILQALCTTGALSYAFAFPVIMGQNIGTCITSILSSVGASINARRTAFLHLFFNLIGTVIFVSAFYSINALVHFGFYNEVATASGIAVIHSVFNITCTILLLPFSKLLVKLVCLIIPDNHEEKHERSAFAVDERFLQKPGFAIEIVRNNTQKACESVIAACTNALKIISEYDDTTAEIIRNEEQNIDDYQDEVGSFLVKLSNSNLNKEDRKHHTILQHSIKDLERITDYSLNILESVENLRQNGITLPEEFVEDCKPLARAINKIMKETTEALCQEDIGKALDTEPLEQVVDELCYEIRLRHIDRLNSGYCSVETGLHIEDILTYLERISDHCSNIAVAVVEISNNSFDTHNYQHSLMNKDRSTFKQIYEAIKKEYSLPAVK